MSKMCRTEEQRIGLEGGGRSLPCRRWESIQASSKAQTHNNVDMPCSVLQKGEPDSGRGGREQGGLEAVTNDAGLQEMIMVKFYFDLMGSCV